MFTSDTSIRVRYAETDKMGYAYYGHYAAYFEVARVEALRTLGLSYRELEDSGIMLPVLEFHIKYFKPAFYDDLLLIRTTIPTKPGVRLHFHYETFNQENVLLNKAEVTLVFINIELNKPCQPPAIFVEALNDYFLDENK